MAAGCWPPWPPRSGAGPSGSAPPISGGRYWPAERGGNQPLQPVQATLREQFQAQHRNAACYRAAAAGASDPCLVELFHESAEEAEAHAWIIRSVLEQM